jgi:hypothetical protein
MTSDGTVTLRVNPHPTFTSQTLQGWTVGVACDQAIPMTDGAPPFTFAITDGEAPPGLSMGTDGRLVGSPTTLGNFPFTVEATDSAGAVVTQVLTFPVRDPPQWITFTVPIAAAGRPYSAPLAVSGGTVPLDWRIDSGDLPQGLSLSHATGVLSGDVAAAGVSLVTVTCADASGARITRTFEITAADTASLVRRRFSNRSTFAPGGAAHVDRFVELVAGTSLTVTFTGGAKDGAMSQITLLGPDGEPIDLTSWTTTTRKSVKVKAFPVPSTGRYFITARPAPGFVGKAKLAVSIAPRAKWVDAATAGVANLIEYAFSAPPGATISATVKAATAASPALPRIVSIQDAADAELLPTGTYAEKGGTATFKTKTALAGGDYRVFFSTRGGTSGPIAWTVKVKVPKKFLFALPDVTAGQ